MNVADGVVFLFFADEAKYKEEPNFTHNITTKQRSLISGITLLRHRLYIVHESCSSIEVYDSKTFTFERNLLIENLANPLDIASSESNQRLYVAGKIRIQSEATKPVKEITQMSFGQLNVKEKDAGGFEIISNEEILSHDNKTKDKSTNDVQKNREELSRKENSSKISEKDPPQKGSNVKLSGTRTTGEAPSDAIDQSSEEHETGEQQSNKDNETSERYQQVQSTDEEKKRLLETTTPSKDGRNESALKESDKIQSQKSDKKNPSSVEYENIQWKNQVQKNERTDGRTDEPQSDTEISKLKACETREAECCILALDASGVLQKSWIVDDAECRLSVYWSSVIVCLLNKRQIIEYSSSAEELRRIGLSPGDGFHQLFHVIRVSHSYFTVSHRKSPRSNDHRLSVIDDKGKVKFTSKISNPLFSQNEWKNMSSYLIADCNKSILMSDAMNCRVLQYNATLNKWKEFIPEEGVVPIRVSNANCLKNQPTRITLDEENGRLFIALNSKDKKLSGNEGVSVFKVV